MSHGNTVRLSRFFSITTRLRIIGRIFFCDASASWSSTCFDPGRDQLP